MMAPAYPAFLDRKLAANCVCCFRSQIHLRRREAERQRCSRHLLPRFLSRPLAPRWNGNVGLSTGLGQSDVGHTELCGHCPGGLCPNDIVNLLACQPLWQKRFLQVGGLYCPQECRLSRRGSSKKPLRQALSEAANTPASIPARNECALKLGPWTIGSV